MSSQALLQFLPLIVIVIVFYFLLMRPQQKRQRQRQSLLQSLQKGDEVVTIGGLHGTIAEINDNTITLRVGDNKMVFERSAINAVSNRGTNS